MKINPKTEAPKSVGTDLKVLFEGDSLTVGVTHHIKISGDDSWVKFEATSKVQPGESAKDAKNRLVGFVDQEAMNTVFQTVESVQQASK